MTARYDEALLYASTLHRDQVRKGSGVAYLAHLMGVSAAVLEMLGNEDEAIAGLLHDSAEDIGAHVLDVIEANFGLEVREIVEACSDSTTKPKPEWRKRKQAYLQRLEAAANAGSGHAGHLRVVLADKLYNARSIWTDLVNDGDESVFDRFTGSGADLGERSSNSRAYYSDVARIYNNATNLPAGCGWHVEELTRVVLAIGGGHGQTLFATD